MLLGLLIYLDLLLPYQTLQTPRSSEAGLLNIPQVGSKTNGEVAFSYCGPQLLHSLPENLGSADSCFVKSGSRPTI